MKRTDRPFLILILAFLLLPVWAGAVPVVKDLIVKEKPYLDVRAYGTITLGAGASGAQKTENALTIKHAIDNAVTPGQKVQLPAGIIYIDGNVVKLDRDHLHLVGQGIHATELYWDSGVAITMSKVAADAIVQSSISDLSLVGQTASNKTGIKVVDGDSGFVHRVTMSTVTGATSTGLQVQGRQTMSFKNLTIEADKPISIEDNPNSTIDADHFHFQDLYLITDLNTQANVTIATGVNLTNVVFDGFQAWVQGKHGLYWNDTTSSVASFNLILRNVRWEQATDSTGWLLYLSHNYKLQNVEVSNIYGALDQATALVGSNGIYLRKVIRSKIDDAHVLSTAGKARLNLDSTVSGLWIHNMYYDSASSESVSGTKLKMINWTDSAIGLAYYEATTNPDFQVKFSNGVPEWAKNFALDNNATQALPITDYMDNIFPFRCEVSSMVTSSGVIDGAATYLFGSDGGNPTVLSTTGNMGIQDNASKVNLRYVSPHTFDVKNLTGSSRTITVWCY